MGKLFIWILLICCIISPSEHTFEVIGSSDIFTSLAPEGSGDEGSSTPFITERTTPEGSRVVIISTIATSATSAPDMSTDESGSADFQTSTTPEESTDETISTANVSTSAIPEVSTDETISTADVSTSAIPEVSTDETISTADVSTSATTEVSTDESGSTSDFQTSTTPEVSTDETISTADVSTSATTEVITDETVSTADISTSATIEVSTLETISTADVSTSATTEVSTDESGSTADFQTSTTPEVSTDETISTADVSTSATTEVSTDESGSTADFQTSTTPEVSTDETISTADVSTSATTEVITDETVSTADISTSATIEVSTLETISTADVSTSATTEVITDETVSTVDISTSATIEVSTLEPISTADVSTSATTEVSTHETISTADVSTSAITAVSTDETISTADVSTSATTEMITDETISTADVSTSATTEVISAADISTTKEVSTDKSTSTPDASTTSLTEVSTDERSTTITSEESTLISITSAVVSQSNTPLNTAGNTMASEINTGATSPEGFTTEVSLSTAGGVSTVPVSASGAPELSTSVDISTAPNYSTVETVTSQITTAGDGATSVWSTDKVAEDTTAEIVSTVQVVTSIGTKAMSASEVPTTPEQKSTSNVIDISDLTTKDHTSTSELSDTSTFKPSTTTQSNAITTIATTASTTTPFISSTTTHITSTTKSTTSIATTIIEPTFVQSTSSSAGASSASSSPNLSTLSTGHSNTLTSVGILNSTITSNIPMTSSFAPVISTDTKYTSISTPFGPLTTTSNTTTAVITTPEIVTCNLACEHGQCYFMTGTTTPACQCTSGYTPDSKQSNKMCIDINECDLNICEQFCSNTIGGYMCTCKDGYSTDSSSPTKCIKNNYCKNSPCVYGQCQNGIYGFTCNCPRGWEGTTCNTDINECTRNNPCSFQSTCINTLGSYICQCRSGWTGQACTEDVNECLQNPCANGKCVNTVGSYACSCFPGYTGAQCTEDINECLSNPCRNGATCNNLVNSFSCSCVPGFTGRFCETNINDCTSTSCGHGGICIDSINAFSCMCPPNWGGLTCTTDVDECATGRSRCSPDATCTNTLGSYICTCRNGFIGDGFTCKEKRLFDYLDGIRATRRTQDFTSPLIDIPTGFAFGSSFYYSLYFTDNGVIVFQKNSYDPFYTMKYPYNFYNYDYFTPPMIAVFWADADLSTMGEIYYQTYDFQASLNQMEFKGELESEINKSFSSLNFKALWAIKITWHQVLPYPAYYFNSLETSTYQAVLVTDGIFSFCLMRFADGGMNWRYYSLPNYYLPKMGYFSGEPTYYYSASNFPSYNDPQTNSYSDIQKRYTPDKYIGQNTNKKGYWSYRLESNTAYTTNYRQKCLAWYYKDITSFPYWIYYSRPCPCSYWQAVFDSSYRQASSLQYYGFQQKNTDWYSSYYTFQSSFSSWYGGGTRCYYNYWGSLSYGEKERYLPTPWEYENSWMRWWNPYYYYYYYYNYIQFQIQQQSAQYKENEIDPYNNCCRYSGSSFLCSLYRQRRPYDFCYGYIPPRIGFLFGDPHINTLDGVKYTFNGLGEYILANVRDENDTVIFRLQGRTARAGNDTQATNFVGLAAIIQNETTIEWILQGSNSTIVKLNGTQFPLPDNSTYVSKITLEKTSTGDIQASFDGGISITVSANQGALSFVTMLETSYKNKTEGLLGIFNDDKTDDFMAANGTKLEYNGVQFPNESLIFEIGMTWKTTPSNSIFMYNETNGESWYTYNNNTFVPKFYDELLRTSSSESIQKANQTCQGNDECIFDILSTGNEALGMATLNAVNTVNEQSSTMNNFPPNVTGPSTISTKLFEPIIVYYTASDDNNDTVIFSLETDSTDINITANGMLVWFPTSSAPINATIAANDSKVTTAVSLTLVLCNCTNNGSCLYDSATSVGNETTTFKVAGCNCSAAWTGMFCEKDFDACAENKCYVNGTCTDLKAPQIGFTCGACPPNLTGDGITCTDINECYDKTSNCQQICNNYLGGYNCSCESGYEVDAMNSFQCNDIDECNRTNQCANNTKCTNLPGNYSCECLAGYEGDPTLLCIDIDECSLNTTFCPNQSVCVNANGFFECQCLQGYRGINCSDIDECLENITDCPLHSHCINMPGLYDCKCQKGYDGENCTDIDECSTTNNCSAWANCTNTDGSYDCTCRNGYTGNGIECVDIDECYVNASICGEKATCNNSIGSYECSCEIGFILINGSCLDDDECSRPEYCSGSGRLCMNTIGSFTCACQPGFTMVNDSCIDIDECLDPNLNNCSVNAVCSNVAGSYDCACKANYTGDGVNCTVIDECHLSTTYCEQNCISFLGGHMCSCNIGYKVNELNNSKCDDIDECANITSPCAGNATCTNLQGNYSCYCLPGFEGEGNFECIDIDECANITSPCAMNATCTNLPGNFSCHCMSGFEGDGMHECIAIKSTTDFPTLTPDSNTTAIDTAATSSTNDMTTAPVAATNASHATPDVNVTSSSLSPTQSDLNLNETTIPVAVTNSSMGTTENNATTEFPTSPPDSNTTAIDTVATYSTNDMTTAPVAATNASHVTPDVNVTSSSLSPTQSDLNLNETTMTLPVAVTDTSMGTPENNATTEFPTSPPDSNTTAIDTVATYSTNDMTTAPVAATNASHLTPDVNVTRSSLSPTQSDLNLNETTMTLPVAVTDTSMGTPENNATTEFPTSPPDSNTTAIDTVATYSTNDMTTAPVAATNASHVTPDVNVTSSSLSPTQSDLNLNETTMTLPVAVTDTSMGTPENNATTEFPTSPPDSNTTAIDTVATYSTNDMTTAPVATTNASHLTPDVNVTRSSLSPTQSDLNLNETTMTLPVAVTDTSMGTPENNATTEFPTSPPDSNTTAIDTVATYSTNDMTTAPVAATNASHVTPDVNVTSSSLSPTQSDLNLNETTMTLPVAVTDTSMGTPENNATTEFPTIPNSNTAATDTATTYSANHSTDQPSTATATADTNASPVTPDVNVTSSNLTPTQSDLNLSETTITTPVPLTNTSMVTAGNSATIPQSNPSVSENQTFIVSEVPSTNTSPVTPASKSIISTTDQMLSDSQSAITSPISNVSFVISGVTSQSTSQSPMLFDSNTTPTTVNPSTDISFITTKTTITGSTVSDNQFTPTPPITNSSIVTSDFDNKTSIILHVAATNTSSSISTLVPITSSAISSTSSPTTLTTSVMPSPIQTANYVAVTNTSTVSSSTNASTSPITFYNQNSISTPAPTTSSAISTTANPTTLTTSVTASPNQTANYVADTNTSTVSSSTNASTSPITFYNQTSISTPAPTTSSAISTTANPTILTTTVTASPNQTANYVAVTNTSTVSSSTNASTSPITFYNQSSISTPAPTTSSAISTTANPTTLTTSVTASPNQTANYVADTNTSTVSPSTNASTSPITFYNQTSISTPAPTTSSAISTTANPTTLTTSVTASPNQTANYVADTNTSTVSPSTNASTSPITFYNQTSISTPAPTTSSAISTSTNSTTTTKQLTVSAIPTTNSVSSGTTPSTSTATSSTTVTTMSSSTTAISSSTSASLTPAVALFPYKNDTSYNPGSIDFTSQVFQPSISFPFGNSLRNFIYYTDNGQIVFPKSKNSKISYPNPPVNGYSKEYDVASIAVFWSDADLSKGGGATYFMEYTSRENEFVKEVEKNINKNLKISYTAQWTLKITWENVPAYPAKLNDYQTNTFQAVLTTDGFQSYVMILFKDGGMNWDTINRNPRQLIGYCSGKGDQFFLNDAIAVNINRPNLYIGSNSDVRGLWIYPLNSAAMDNSRMNCLNWFNAQPDPSSWNSNLLSCPCLYQQGRNDSRFRTTKAGGSNSVSLLRSTSLNRNDAGVRCVYKDKNQFLEGFQEKWNPLSSPNTELQAYDWCCNKVDDPRFCIMYMQKRPSINCRDYKPPNPGWMYGDPHITTLDGYSFTFNGLGDFILLNASGSGTSLVLQGRTVQTGTAMATNFQAFAVQYISSSANVIVEWYLEVNKTMRVLLNSQNVVFFYSDDMDTNIYNNNTAVFLKNDNSKITATFEGFISVEVSAVFDMLTAVTNLPDTFFNNTKGLLGNWNNDQSDDFCFKNGTTLPLNSSESQIFYYGLDWAVSGTSLFTQVQVMGRDIFIPIFFSDLQNLPQYAKFQDACGNNIECIYDAMSTNNTQLGLATLTVSEQLFATKTLLKAEPPSISGNTTITAFLGTTVTVEYSVPNSTGVHFSADTYSDIKLTENGILTWKPTSMGELTFTLTATDSKNLSSTLLITFVLCGCQLSSQCNYAEKSKVNASSLYITSCNCNNNNTGDFCEIPPNLCAQGCYPGVQCDNKTGCGACPPGFTGDGLHCSDINECLQNQCSMNSTCTNTQGNFTCECNIGFTGNGFSCVEIDKCQNSCSPNASCISTSGNYSCICKNGFEGNGIYCADKDECQTSNSCSSDAFCKNTLGSYTCTCKNGFTGNGTFCADIDECQTSNSCSSYASCINTLGSYTCTCDQCNENYCSNGGTCTRIGQSCTQHCQCPVAFSGETCKDAVDFYMAVLSPATKRRSINVTFTSSSSINSSDCYDKISQILSKATYGSALINLFDKTNSKIDNLGYAPGTFKSIYVAKWSYVANVTLANYLNNDLANLIKTTRSKRSADQLTISNVVDDYKLSLQELAKLSSCGYPGYEVNSSDLMCYSKCYNNTSYCKNNGTCVLINGNISCSCKPFTMYVTSGPQCDTLSMNLNAFFGLLFGTLAFLLLILGIGLGIYYYRRKKQENNAANWYESRIIKKSPFSSFQRLEESEIPNVKKDTKIPHLVSWKPHLEKVNSFTEVNIKRPEVRNDYEVNLKRPEVRNDYEVKLKRPEARNDYEIPK
ncbi:uncharacterized protein [Engystomops pustulosus]|uniref:uncharacterized protein n=1 Tax=Engystomops pustulosus TaxID=76066 RepID=UPI003AFA8FF7